MSYMAPDLVTVNERTTWLSKKLWLKNKFGKQIAGFKVKVHKPKLIFAVVGAKLRPSWEVWGKTHACVHTVKNLKVSDSWNLRLEIICLWVCECTMRSRAYSDSPRWESSQVQLNFFYWVCGLQSPDSRACRRQTIIFIRLLARIAI